MQRAFKVSDSCFGKKQNGKCISKLDYYSIEFYYSTNHMKPLIVIKFGGTSLASVQHIRESAKITKNLTNSYRVITVVSAMAKFTNTLVNYTEHFHEVNDLATSDVVLASGEQITAGLFALALQELGLKAKPLLGWQVPVITTNQHNNARIKSIPSEELITLSEEQGVIPVVAGFQGITTEGRITTLGRGGSDTTAVALAAATNACACYIYSDVKGVYAADPNLVKHPCLMTELESSMAVEMSMSGAKILHCRSAELGLKYHVPIWVKSTFNIDHEGTLVNPSALAAQEPNASKLEKQSTLRETQAMFDYLEGPVLSSIVTSNSEVYFKIEKLSKDVSEFSVLTALLEKGVVIDLLTRSEGKGGANLEFTVAKSQLKLTLHILEVLLLNMSNVIYNTEVAKLSLMGIGLQSSKEILGAAFRAFKETTSTPIIYSLANLKLSFLIPEKDLAALSEKLYREVKDYIKVFKSK